jgi:hypothetical protein
MAVDRKRGRVSAKERREMQAQIDALEAASADVLATFKTIAPYLLNNDPAKMPLPTWTPDHFGLILAELVRDNATDGPVVERWMKESPILLLSITATLIRIGYAIKEYEPR